MANRETTFIEITPEVLLKAYACGIFPMAALVTSPVRPGTTPEASAPRLSATTKSRMPKTFQAAKRRLAAKRASRESSTP